MSLLTDDHYSLRRAGKGHFSLFSFDSETKEILRFIEKPNLILYGAADILAKLLGGVRCPISVMYLEYCNGTPSTPTYDRSGGKSYYDSLASSLTKDYLRIPLITTPVFSASGENYASNEVTFFAVSEGTVGVHGKAFSNTAGSQIFGAALVAAAESGDADEDIVLSRAYATNSVEWETPIAKIDGQQIGATWKITLT